MYEWRSCRSCTFRNNVHLVFVTKYRRAVFTKEMIDRLRSDCHSKANALQGLDPPLKKRDCALNFVQQGLADLKEIAPFHISQQGEPIIPVRYLLLTLLPDSYL
ncbi:transposase [Endozoicomonas sp. 4G]|uniref:transposase n=1 Tax=Endozoicomonas sp. 4G TaxID=2872754 RepID=UPI0021111A50|nr:transposase [Endozoicomonas sp. 4G]